MKADKAKIEKIANAIKFLVPLHACGAWTPYGIKTIKWPKDFSKTERQTIRLIAKTALQASRSRT